VKQEQNFKNDAKRQKSKEAARVNGQRIRQLRETLSLTQGSFAAKCGVSRTAVPLWENGKASPSQRCWSRMALLAREAPAIDKAWFFQQAGIDLEYLSQLFPEFGRISRESEQRAISIAAAVVEGSAKGITAVPLLRVPAHLDRPLSTRPEEIEDWLSLPEAMLEKNPKIVALRVSPAFIRPIFSFGDIVFIDTGDREVKNLHGALVLASYKPNSETKTTAEHVRRGQPVAEHVKGMWPHLSEGLYLGWLEFDTPGPESRVRPLNLISAKLHEMPVPMHPILPFVVPIAVSDPEKLKDGVVIEGSETVIQGRVLGWIASPKSLVRNRADGATKKRSAMEIEDLNEKEQTQLPAQKRRRLMKTTKAASK